MPPSNQTHHSSGTPIRIIESDNNKRGDLFGRLMADLFVPLGYDQPRLNIHKSREHLVAELKTTD